MESASHFDATVIVTLDAKAMAGRPGFKSGIRPNHRIPGHGTRCFIGALTFEGKDWLRPGESTKAEGKFIVYTSDVPLFEPGFRWNLCEGMNVVGSVELISRGESTDLPTAADSAELPDLGVDAPDLQPFGDFNRS